MQTLQHIKFQKMHGLGNDFIVLDARSSGFDIKDIPIKTLAARHIGIGFDQLLLLQNSDKADFYCRFFNADGKEAEMCGNGLRCLARYVHEKKLIDKKEFVFETQWGQHPVRLVDYQHITVSLDKPIFIHEKIPVLPEKLTDLPKLHTVSVGNPHAILVAKYIDEIDVNVLGNKISTHPAFPNGTNVGFMEIKSSDHIKLRTYERGVGETFACGSNSCAAVVVGIKNNLLNNTVRVELPYGELTVQWNDNNSPVLLTGPAESVFEGNVLIG